MNATKSRQKRVSLPPPPRGRHRTTDETILENWRAQPVSLRVLRAFLGVTFVYAGIQKLADPNFLHAGSPHFIGTQLQSFAQGSPIGGPLRLLAHAPVLTGIGIAVVEIAIGLATLAGIAPLLFAFGGFLVNLILTLSASWHIHPYFLGSDSIYAVAWLAYLLGTAEAARRVRRADARAGRRSGAAPGEISRRELVRGGLLAGATLVTASAAAALAGSRTGMGISSRLAKSGAGAGQGTAAAGAGSSTTITTLSQIPVGGAIGFNAPGVGPAALVRLSQERVVAYSRVCTHAGCLVGYDPSSRLLVCPCHGAEFDPARQAEVVAGPAPSPLSPVQVAVDPSGQVVIPS